MENVKEKKPFFKSESFKCIIVLLLVLLISGAFLTVSYGFLEVSAAERKQRAIDKVYGQSMGVTEQPFTPEQGKFATSTVLEAYIDDNGDCLVKCKGSGGWAGGVTCWILVDIDGGAIKKVSKVIIESSDGETLLNNIDYLDKFTKTDYVDGFEYTTGNGFVTSGASMSSGAIDNSVNGAINFVNTVCLNKTDPYADYRYRDFIDMEYTMGKATADGGVITYDIKTKANPPARPFTFTVKVGADKKIVSFVIVEHGSTNASYDEKADAIVANFAGKNLKCFTDMLGEDLTQPDKGDNTEISTGATRSSYLCVCAAAFALSNYDLVLGGLAQ